MKPVPFEYCRPETVGDAVALLAEMREEAAVLAGGMTLGPMLNLRLVRPRAVVDITRIGNLRSIEVRGDRVITGATVIQADALAAEHILRHVPLLAQALPWVGHFQTRNRGTLGGSVVHADPSAEIPLCLVALDGTVVVRAKRRERRIRARDFFVGALTTARRPDELLVALEWPLAPPNAGHAFEEIAQRHGDFALAAAACQVCLDDSNRLASVSLALGGVENRPFAVSADAFHARPATREIAREIAEFATSAITPMEDVVVDAEYRIALSRVLVERVISRAIANAQARQGGVQ